jgi:hypothetical protein
MARRAVLASFLSIATAIGAAGVSPRPADGSARLVGVVTDSGLHTVEYQTPEGTLRVYLPSDLAAGDTISGTVAADPAGDDDRQQQANRAKLEGYVVEVAGEPAQPDGGGRWQVADAPALSVVLRDAVGRDLARGEVPVLAGAPLASGFVLPEIGQAGDPLAIPGPFDGDAGGTRVSLGGAPAEVLAESPRQAVIATPAGAAGPTEIVVEEGGVRTAGTVRLVALGLSAGDLSLQRGETTEMTLTLSGLAGLERPVAVTVVNASPQVVRLDGPGVVVVEPGEVGADGRYRRDWTLSGVVPGGFSIQARVTSMEPERILTITPAPGTAPGGRPDFEWRPHPTPSATYELTLSRVLDPTGEPLSDRDSLPPEGGYTLDPVLRAEDLADPRYAYPADAPTLDPGLYAWRVVAFVPGRPPGSPGGDTGPLLISAAKCRCEESGTTLTARLSKDDARLTTATMKWANPETITLPPGPIDVEVVGADLGCKKCGGERCEVSGITHTPATAAITPTEESQTLEVTTQWSCERTGCVTDDSCEKVYKLKYKLAANACLCGEIAATVNVGDATRALACNTGIEGPQIIDLGDEVAAGAGDRLTIRLSSFTVGCWCGAGVCDSEAPNDADARADRPVTIDLGENDAEDSSNNINLVRLEGGGWQADGSYEFDVRVKDAKLRERNVYQDVTLKATCTRDDCTAKLCTCTWRLALGSLEE